MMKKMNFDEFKSVVVEGIKKWLPESFGKVEISMKIIEKNNDMKLTGVLIKRIGSNIAPMIYLEGFYKQYQEGSEMEEIIRRIVKLRLEHDQVDGINVDMISNFEDCKDKISLRLINTEWNKHMLENRPHVEIEDLSVVFAINLGANENGLMSIPVTYDLVKKWNVEVEELYEIAVKNQENADDGLFVTMSDMIMGLIGEDVMDAHISDADDNMFVLTNKSKVLGASMLLNKRMMEKVRERVGNDFYIIPSSIHEVLVVPDKNHTLSIGALEAMVNDVNTTQVELPDRLSAHVYRYTDDGIRVA